MMKPMAISILLIIAVFTSVFVAGSIYVKVVATESSKGVTFTISADDEVFRKGHGKPLNKDGLIKVLKQLPPNVSVLVEPGPGCRAHSLGSFTAAARQAGLKAIEITEKDGLPCTVPLDLPFRSMHSMKKDGGPYLYINVGRRGRNIAYGRRYTVGYTEKNTSRLLKHSKVEESVIQINIIKRGKNNYMGYKDVTAVKVYKCNYFVLAGALRKLVSEHRPLNAPCKIPLIISYDGTALASEVYMLLRTVYTACPELIYMYGFSMNILGKPPG